MKIKLEIEIDTEEDTEVMEELIAALENIKGEVQKK
jgi:hypothetical protein